MERIVLADLGEGRPEILQKIFASRKGNPSEAKNSQAGHQLASEGGEEGFAHRGRIAKGRVAY